MKNVRRDGSFVVFRLPHSEEDFRLPAAEARHLGTALVNVAWQIDEGRPYIDKAVSLAVPDVVWQPRAGWSGDGNV